MDGRNQPPIWKLWNANQGVVFQQPLYPALDSARSFTQASAVHEVGTGPTGVEEDMARDASELIQRSLLSHGKSAARKTSKERGLQATSIESARLVSQYTAAGVDEAQTETVELIDAESTAQAAAVGQKPDATAAEEAPSGPPFAPLDYKIPDDVFQAAIEADEGAPESFWSYTLYRGPDGDKGKDAETKVKVHYCKSALTAERVCQYFVNEKIIGFDLEWDPNGYLTPSPRRNVSLVQIASQSRIALLHLAMYPSKDELATPTLRQILENPEITKVGVWIKGDSNRLKKYTGIKPRGIFELSNLYKQVKYSANGRPDLINKQFVSLENQVREILRLPLFKGSNVRKSDWSRELSLKQMHYSASDAYASVHLFATLNHLRENLNPTPALPFHVELEKPIPLAIGVESSSSDESEVAEFEAEAEADADADAAEPEAMNVDPLEATEERLKALGQRVKAVWDTIQVEDDDEEVAASKPPSKPSTPKRAAKATKPAPPPKDPRVVAAETWAKEYRSRPSGKAAAGAAALRAYFIWHANEDLDPESIGALLRDPPLTAGTVMGYILSSIKLEKLPYDRARLKREVLDDYPKDIARLVYSGLLREVENGTGSPSEPTGI